MISVDSISPTTISVVWALRRTMFRSPIRASSGLRQAIQPMTVNAPAISASSEIMMLVREMPNRLSICRQLAISVVRGPGLTAPSTRSTRPRS